MFLGKGLFDSEEFPFEWKYAVVNLREQKNAFTGNNNVQPILFFELLNETGVFRSRLLLLCSCFFGKIYVTNTCSKHAR